MSCDLAEIGPIPVAVRTLCEFAARSGDLDHRYTPSPSAEEGIAGHLRVRSRRPIRYVAELSLSGQCEGLLVSGRADGYDPERCCLEEIKTHRGDLSRLSLAQQALHWAQLHVYGALLCAQDNLDRIELALVYYDIGRQRETRLKQHASSAELWQLLVRLCRTYRDWARQENTHRGARDSALNKLQFPYPAFREGQRTVAETVFKAICTRHHLLLQAPTGLGKTVGTLFPALMAMPREGLDRIFYLTSRNTGRRLAIDGLKTLIDAQPAYVPLRVLELSAKEHVCEHPDLACNGESCPLARGFFDRLAVARQSAIDTNAILDRNKMREIALAHHLCPYHLSQEMARWADIVVGDVNRYFDLQASLHALTVQNNWKTTLLIDEGHNLIDRARGMYSMEATQQRVLAAKRIAPPPLKRALGKLARQWSNIVSRHELDAAAGDRPVKVVQLNDPPQEITNAALICINAITEYLSDEPVNYELQELFFEIIRYVRLAECYGDHSLCELRRSGRGRAVLSIRNMIPADFLASRFASAHNAILFSATLAPALYRRDLLGLPNDTQWLEVESPFSARQLHVHLVTTISTRMADRDASIEPIVELMRNQYRQRPGNYLAYFSSFAYLESVYARFQEQEDGISTWRQWPSMSPQARQEFVDSFCSEGRGIGFAVLGGAFAEGIDLPGSRLVGAFVATLGLPPFDEWHEILRERLQQRFGCGYDYAYLFPGLQKVAQAAGRVIRTPEDEGVVILIDDRFAIPGIRRLLPRWWFENDG